MSKFKPKIFILDVDGVLTDGKFLYSTDGKMFKTFGADDNDGLSLLKPYMEIRFISGDKRGFDITKKRVHFDMGFPLDCVSTIKRVAWIKERYDPKDVIYMGDGIFDHYVFREVGYSIATSNSDTNAKEFADFITKREGSERAVAEACLHILEKFFDPYNPLKLPKKGTKMSDSWGV